MANRPLSICMFSNLFPPVVSGSSTQSSTLARELVRRGHQVVVITARISDETPAYEVIEGVHVYRLPALRLPRLPIALNFPWLSLTFTPGNQRRIVAIIERHQPDLLHLHNHMFDLAFSAVRMRRRFHKPLVVTIHTMIKHSRRLYNAVLYPADRWFLRRAVLNQADAILCPDVNIQDYVAEAFGRGQAAGTTDSFIVPYGISLPDAPVDGLVEKLRAKYHLDGKRVILSLGHVHEIRNRKDLVEALPEVLKAFPEAVLLVVGAVATQTPVVLARSLGVQDSVIFTGPVAHHEVPGYLALAEIEGHWLNQDDPARTSLGIASLEAMSAGKPILAAANPDTYGRGVLRPGENFLLVEPGQPQRLAQTLTDLLADPTRRQTIGAQAQADVRAHFSWESICAQTIQVYDDTLQKFVSLSE